MGGGAEPSAAGGGCSEAERPQRSKKASKRAARWLFRAPQGGQRGADGVQKPCPASQRMGTVGQVTKLTRNSMPELRVSPPRRARGTGGGAFDAPQAPWARVCGAVRTGIARSYPALPRAERGLLRGNLSPLDRFWFLLTAQKERPPRRAVQMMPCIRLFPPSGDSRLQPHIPRALR